MLKVMLLLKRKPGMTLVEFIDRYERVHAPLVSRTGSKAKRYERHYLHPRGRFLWDDEVVEPEYDVVTELWYEDLETFEALMAGIRAHPERIAPILADEHEMFDRDKCRVTLVESHLSPPAANAAADRSPIR